MIKGPVAEKIGFVLTRLVVPLWVLAGAAFKLYERTPSNLPSQFLETAKNMGVDLGVMLHTLIALEFLAIAVMFFMPRLARAMAIFMLSCFVLILLNELRRKADSCGCFGSIDIPPEFILGVDGALLLGVILFRQARCEDTKPFLGLLPAGVTFLAGGIASFALMEGGAPTPPIPVNPSNPETVAQVIDGSTLPLQEDLPTYWYAEDIESWPGKYWSELRLFRLIRTWPDDIAQGRKHIVLYRRDCDHCEEMFYDHFMGQVEDPVIAYRIASDAMWDMPPTEATLLDMPDACDWIVTTPLVITLVDGKVQCAIESEGFEACLEPSEATP